MRTFFCALGTYLLAMMLAGTFPVGAGDAGHGGALLHPVLPHVHTLERGPANGRVTPIQVHPTRGTAMGAGAGATETLVGTALTPPAPVASPGFLDMTEHRLLPLEMPAPIGRLNDPPPDPPPPPVG